VSGHRTAPTTCCRRSPAAGARLEPLHLARRNVPARLHERGRIGTGFSGCGARGLFSRSDCPPWCISARDLAAQSGAPRHENGEMPMSIATLFSYLVGNRSAILRIATTRGTLLLGALLVLSAGFAREYDQADLLHEPWRLLIPFAASLATS